MEILKKYVGLILGAGFLAVIIVGIFLNIKIVSELEQPLEIENEKDSVEPQRATVLRGARRENSFLQDEAGSPVKQEDEQPVQHFMKEEAQASEPGYQKPMDSLILVN